MVRIRLSRVGAKGQPSYRVVVVDSRSPRDGRFIEKIGFHNPRTSPETIEIDEARALHWLQKGAQPSEAVHRILDRAGTLKRFEQLRAGESIDDLVAQAKAEAAARPAVDPRTRQDRVSAAAPKKAKGSKKAEAEPAAEETASEA